MIQEKDFLYRVPVKNALVATPGQQVRNPEILVDLEGGEFMRGNMLDANSTNKLINQSVKDAVDNKLIESGYVTQDLLDAETSARTKGDEDLSAKIQAEQTRAEGKEKEISDKLAIVDGDSNTEGSFRKAIADVVAAAPEDLDTLKEIADKLAGNDDLHTALNQAITEKADTSALLNEVTRATGVENDLKTAISAKQDKPDDGKEFLQGESDGGTIVVNNALRLQDSIHDQVFSVIGSAGITVYNNADSESQVNIMSTGILADDERKSDTKVWNTNGGITDLLPYATNKDVGKQFNEISIGMSNFADQIALKQNKITANTIDVTGIETADISKLRTIVSNLLDALTLSGLIKQNVEL